MQNNGHLSKDPPKHLGTLAKACWRKIVPFLESTDKVQRIDSSLVELYCVQYETYRKAYQDVCQNGIQSKIYRSLQDVTGEIVGKDFTGYRKNPAVATMKDAINQLSAIGSELGLTPRSRAELLSLANQNNSKKSAAETIQEFFAKGGK